MRPENFRDRTHFLRRLISKSRLSTSAFRTIRPRPYGTSGGSYHYRMLSQVVQKGLKCVKVGCAREIIKVETIYCEDSHQNSDFRILPFDGLVHVHMRFLVVNTTAECFPRLFRRVLNAWMSDGPGEFSRQNPFFAKINLKITILNFCISNDSTTPVWNVW